MHKIEWESANRKAQCPANPDFPNGLTLDFAAAMGVSQSCEVDLPYPAECCGAWRISCTKCGLSLGVTAAGRSDDPRRIMMPCYYKQIGGALAPKGDPRKPF